jgi:lipopolysaccharide/colanic/teichoic acid biosynthesis glycosyltransferase/GGDEF domain-containing protein
MIKRLFDIFFSALGLVFLSPVFLLIGVLVKRDSPGPMFYRGPRVGKGGKVFRMLKFRTMYERPECYAGPRLTCESDTRITPIGRWLRDTKLNELPQLWNVLKGDMSLVGPRPEDPELMKSWPAMVASEVLAVRPGVTSPASVLYHSEQELLSSTELIRQYFRDIMPDKLRLDQLYVRNRSFSSDLDVLLCTMALYAPHTAGKHVSEAYLFSGPFVRLVHRHAAWFVLDLLTAFAAAGIAGFLWRERAPLDWGILPAAVFALLFALIFSGVNWLVGLNRIIWSQATAEDGVGLLLTSGLVTGVTLVLDHLQFAYQLLPYPPLPPVMIVAIGALTQLGSVLTRYRMRLIGLIATPLMRRRSPGYGERVIIVGEGEGCQIASWLLRHRIFRHAFSLVGLVTTENPRVRGMQVHGCSVLGGLSELPQLIRHHDVRMLIYTVPDFAGHGSLNAYDACRTSGVKVAFLDDLLAILGRQFDHAETSDAPERRTPAPGEETPAPDEAQAISNRVLLQRRLRRSLALAERRMAKPAMLFIDIDEKQCLQKLDDPDVRDELLALITERLLRVKRESDLLAMYTRKDFALLLENVPDKEAVRTIAQRIVRLMLEPFNVRGVSLVLNADVDVCLMDPEDLDSSEEDLVEFCAARRHSPLRFQFHGEILPGSPEIQ